MKEFFHMGGYGFYVWGAYGLSLLVLALNAMAARIQIRRARREIEQSGDETP